MRKPPLWSRPYTNLILLNLSVFIIMFLQIGTFPKFILNLGGNNFQAGLAIGLYTGIAFSVRPLAGYLIDRYNRKIILILGTAVFLLSLLPFLVISTILQFMVLRIIGGAAFGFITTASLTLVADAIPESRLGEGLGIFTLTGVFSTAVGPATGLAVVASLGYRSLFLIIIGIGVFGLAAAVVLSAPKRKSSGGSSEAAPPPKISPFLFTPSLVFLFFSTTMGVILTFIPLLGIARSIEGISLFFTVYSIAIAASRLPASRIFDTVPPALLFTISAVLLFTSFMGIAFSYHIIPIIIAAVFFGIGWGVLQPLLNAIQIKRVPVSRRGTASGIFYLAMDMGITLGSVAFGIILEVTSFLTLFLLCSLLVLMGIFLFYRLIYKTLQ